MKLEHSRFAKISAKLEQRCSLSFNSGAHEGLNGLWVLFKTGNTCCNAVAKTCRQPLFQLASPVRRRSSSLPPTTRLEASCWRCAAALREGRRWGAVALHSSRSRLWHGGAHDAAHGPRRPARQELQWSSPAARHRLEAQGIAAAGAPRRQHDT